MQMILALIPYILWLFPYLGVGIVLLSTLVYKSIPWPNRPVVVNLHHVWWLFTIIVGGMGLSTLSAKLGDAEHLITVRTVENVAVSLVSAFVAPVILWYQWHGYLLLGITALDIHGALREALSRMQLSFVEKQDGIHIPSLALDITITDQACWGW